MAFKLYLANTTKQHRIFTYRILHKRADGSIPGAATWPIKPGGQICIDDNFTKAEIDEIIAQNVKYGLKSASEVSRVKNFVGIVYDTEKPVSMDSMLERFEKNDSVLGDEAQRRRELTAAAISTNIAKDLAERTGRDPETLRPERVEVQQVEDTAAKPQVASGVEVPGNPNVKPRRARA
jgi:hypothetical protein